MHVRRPRNLGIDIRENLLDQLMPIPEAITITSDNYLKLSSLALEPGYFIAEQYALQRIHGENNLYRAVGRTMRANVDMLIASGLRAKSLVCGRSATAGTQTACREEVGGRSNHRQHLQGLAGIFDRYVFRRKNGDCGQDRLQGSSTECLRAGEDAAITDAPCFV